ncbi:MAG: LON peptidase substrate-binding domain-containing protein [bacterium]
METLLQALAQYMGEIPMFPLPQIVFFPHTILPLHIFEPRYRQMIRDMRDQGLPIVMGNVKPGQVVDAQGRPEVFPVAGVGFMTKCEELPDGRFLVELDGLARVEILEEHDTQKLYRLVKVALRPDEDDDPTQAQERLETLQVLVMSLGQQNERVGGYLQQLLRKAPTPSAAADSIAAAIVSDPSVRQSLLEETSVLKRLDVVVSRMAELLALAARADKGTPLN